MISRMKSTTFTELIHCRLTGWNRLFSFLTLAMCLLALVTQAETPKSTGTPPASCTVIHSVVMATPNPACKGSVVTLTISTTSLGTATINGVQVQLYNTDPPSQQNIDGNLFPPPGPSPFSATITVPATLTGTSYVLGALIYTAENCDVVRNFDGRLMVKQGPPPTITNFASSGDISCGNPSVRLTGAGFGESFIFTGPNGYVFSNVFRDAAAHNAFATEVKVPGTYKLTTIGPDCSKVESTVVVGGTACQ